MVTISHMVKKLVEENPFIVEGLSRELISQGGLCSELKPKIEKELGKKIKDSAVIMAIRRYTEQIQLKDLSKKKFNLSTEIIMKTNISDFCLRKTPSILDKIKKFYKMVDYSGGDFLNIIVGNNEVSIALSSKHIKKSKDILKGEKILSSSDNLVALTIIFTGDFVNTPGIIFQAVRKLAWENINIYEIISTNTELTFIVKNSDSMKSYEVLQDLIG